MKASIATTHGESLAGINAEQHRLPDTSCRRAAGACRCCVANWSSRYATLVKLDAYDADSDAKLSSVAFSAPE